jgi:mevalonate kinase
MNQSLLNTIGVGHRALDTVVDVAAQHNCVGKLTGAGGGGCAIVAINEEKLQAINKSVEDLENSLR